MATQDDISDIADILGVTFQVQNYGHFYMLQDREQKKTSKKNSKNFDKVNYFLSRG